MRSTATKLAALSLAATLALTGSGVQMIAEEYPIFGVKPETAEEIRTFPVTMYNYNGYGELRDNERGDDKEGNTINDAIRGHDYLVNGVWNGMYFYEQELKDPNNVNGLLEGFRFMDYGHIYDVQAEPVLKSTTGGSSVSFFILNSTQVWYGKTVYPRSTGQNSLDNEIEGEPAFAVNWDGVDPSEGGQFIAICEGSEAYIANMKLLVAGWGNSNDVGGDNPQFSPSKIVELSNRKYAVYYDTSSSVSTKTTFAGWIGFNYNQVANPVTVYEVRLWDGSDEEVTPTGNLWTGYAEFPFNKYEEGENNYRNGAMDAHLSDFGKEQNKDTNINANGDKYSHAYDNTNTNLTTSYLVSVTYKADDPGKLKLIFTEGGAPYPELVATVASGENYISYYKLQKDYDSGYGEINLTYTGTGSAKIYSVDYHTDLKVIVLDSMGADPVSSIVTTSDIYSGYLPTLTWSLCTFGGWYTDEEFTEQVQPNGENLTLDTPVTTYYAKWTARWNGEPILGDYDAVRPEDLEVREQYYIYNLRKNLIVTSKVVTEENQNETKTGFKGVNRIENISQANGETKDIADTFVWTLVEEDGGYALKSEATGQYLNISADGGSLSPNRVKLTIASWKQQDGTETDDLYDVTIKVANESMFLNDYGGTGEDWKSTNGNEVFGNNDVSYDDGNAFYILKADDFYAPWSHWVGDSDYVSANLDDTSFAAGPQFNGNTYNEDRIFTGLVDSKLDEDDNIVFKYTAGDAEGHGIFSDDEVYKDRYTGVNIPFVWDSLDRSYTFDADQMGAHFEGEPRDDTILKYGADEVQYIEDGNPGWFPFNTKSGYLTQDERDYHFGMEASFDFTMTDDGYIDVTGGNDIPIKFEFSGDDDVWVFIDGKLVLDMGGIHSEVGGEINFASYSGKGGVTVEHPNTWRYTNCVDAGGKDVNAQPTTVSGGAQSGRLFNTEEGEEGILGMTLKEFAGAENHTLTIFYLERGKGDSNIRIKFNLPMQDVVYVTKHVNYAVDSQDLAELNFAQHTTSAAKKSALDEIRRNNFTDAEIQQIQNTDFYFTLYRGDADGNNYQPVAGAHYYVLDEQSNVKYTDRVTGNNGEFALKAGETAKFVMEGGIQDSTYYVTEQASRGYGMTRYYYYSARTNGEFYDHTPGANSAVRVSDAHTMDNTFHNYYRDGDTSDSANDGQLESRRIRVVGNNDYGDSIAFISENDLIRFTDPTVIAEELRIVLDYGLPVLISPVERANIQNLGPNQEVRLTNLKCVTPGWNNPEDNIFGDDNIISLQGKYGRVENQIYRKGENNNVWDSAVGVRSFDKLTYALNAEFNGIEVFEYTLQIYDTSRNTYLTDSAAASTGKIYIMPATSVYYEESFNRAGYSDAGGTGLIHFSGVDGYNTIGLWNGWRTDYWEFEYQEPGVVNTYGDSPYASDKAYKEDTWDSDETVMHVYTRDPNNPTGPLSDADVKDPYFSYSFTGTGTTIYARMGSTSGYIHVTVKDKATGQCVEGVEGAEVLRDTIYQTGENTSQIPLDGSSSIEYFGMPGEVLGSRLYNIPVYNLEDLDYGEYEVTVTVKTPTVFNDGENKLIWGYEFALDGIRIHDPLGKPGNLVNDLKDQTDLVNGVAASSYATDGEANNDQWEVRDKLLDADGWNDYVVFTDSNGLVDTQANFKQFGPKNEVYLNANQSISFTVKDWNQNINKAYVGIKSPSNVSKDGNRDGYTPAKVNVNGEVIEIRNAADCYYEVKNPSIRIVDDVTYADVTIKAEADSLIAITDVRVTGRDIQFVDQGGNVQQDPVTLFHADDWSTYDYINNYETERLDIPKDKLSGVDLASGTIVLKYFFNDDYTDIQRKLVLGVKAGDQDVSINNPALLLPPTEREKGPEAKFEATYHCQNLIGSLDPNNVDQLYVMTQVGGAFVVDVTWYPESTTTNS